MKHIKDIERLESILASGSKSRRSDAAYAEQGNRMAAKMLARLASAPRNRGE